MSDSKVEPAKAQKLDVNTSQDQQAEAPSQQASSPTQPSSPASTSHAVTAKTPSKTAEDSSSRRKREREGSLEPAQLTPSRATEAIPAKKNRVEDSLQEEDDDEVGTSSVETEKVGQIRKKVDELSTKELELKSAQSAADPNSADAAAETKATTSDAASELATTTQTQSDSTDPTAQPKSTETQASKPAQDPPARTQPTFSSFSSKSSPFSSVPSSSGSSSAAASKGGGFSAFAAKSSSPLVGSGIKPSSLGSSIGGHHDENGPASPLSGAAKPAVAPSKPIVKGQAFGFGAFAGASPLAKPKADSPAASEKESDEPKSTDDKASFEQKLLSHDKDAAAAAETKQKPLLEAVEAESKSLVFLVDYSPAAFSVC